MDPTTTVGLVSIATAVVTTTGGVAVALLTNRREAENAAETASEEATEKASAEKEAALRERIVLKDEQIAALEKKVQNRDEKIARLEADLAARLDTALKKHQAQEDLDARD